MRHRKRSRAAKQTLVMTMVLLSALVVFSFWLSAVYWSCGM